MTVTRLPISWHHLVRAARRPGKAVLVASGPVAGQERLGHVTRNRAGEVDRADRHLPQPGPVRLVRPAIRVRCRRGRVGGSAGPGGPPVATLSRGLELLESSVSYVLAGAAPATPQLLSRPTPCPDWDLEALLGHVGDSIMVLREAIATGSAAASAVPPGHPGPEPGPLARLRGQAAGLLGACAAAGPAGRRVAIEDRELTACIVAVTGAIEIAVHGWDISVACGTRRPVPPGLAAVLAPIAPCSSPLVPGPGCSPGRSGCPARPAPPTSSSPSSAASRAPRPRPGPATPKPGTGSGRPGGDSRVSGWSISMGRQASGAETAVPREDRNVGK